MSGVGDLTTKIENILMENLPHVKELITEKVGSLARGAVDSEEICRLVATKIFKFMPRQIKMTISEMEFADIFWKKRHAIFSRERSEEVRGGVTRIELAEIEVIQRIYSKIEEQRIALDEIFNDVKLLEGRMKKNSSPKG